MIVYSTYSLANLRLMILWQLTYLSQFSTETEAKEDKWEIISHGSGNGWSSRSVVCNVAVQGITIESSSEQSFKIEN